MLPRYKTIDVPSEIEIIEKKSRFIGRAIPVTEETEAQEWIISLRKSHFDASHTCYAYQIGEQNQLQRFSDDGEPGGTAGMPILNVLQGEDVKNVAIAVTRYFGGTLLGTGGLVRAYGKAAKEALLAAGIVQKVLQQVFHVTVDYTLSGKIQYDILNNNHLIQDTVYTDTVTFVVLVEIGRTSEFIQLMENASAGTALIVPLEQKYNTLQI